jgi:hypothetical protein
MMRAVAAHDPAEQRWLLQLVCHHLVLDHTTLELLVEEMRLMQRGRHDLLPPAVPLRACIAQAQRGSTVLEQQAFFSTALGDVTEPTAPFDALDVQGDGRAIGELRTALDAELAGELRREARRQGVGAATLFHLAWAMVLAKTTGRNDVVFGTVLFGRMAGAERALGCSSTRCPCGCAWYDTLRSSACNRRMLRLRRCCITSTPAWRWRSVAAACPAVPLCLQRCSTTVTGSRPRPKASRRTGRA